MWVAYDGGVTIGTEGGEGGRIVRDEEHAAGARLTLEEGGRAIRWSATCGVYGLLVHTVFFRDQAEADSRWEELKCELAAVALGEAHPQAFVNAW